jgi:inosose dehydratase
MGIRVANGPVSWGVDMPDMPDVLPWEQVFSEIAAAGYEWCELGPAGYVPDDDARVGAALEARGLRVAGTFIFEPIHDRARHDHVAAVTRRTCDRIRRLGGGFLVVINMLTGERAATAGCSDVAPRLDTSGVADRLAGLRMVTTIAYEHGLTPVLHSHAGTPIEFEDELVEILDATADDGLQLCIDTGHLAYAGIDPVRFVADHRDRIPYLHFKDVDSAVHARVLDERIGYSDAVALGVFCPIGTGRVDFEALAAALGDDFDGPGTVEQDRDRFAETTALEDARASLRALRELGLVDERLASDRSGLAGWTIGPTRDPGAGP